MLIEKVLNGDMMHIQLLPKSHASPKNPMKSFVVEWKSISI